MSPVYEYTCKTCKAEYLETRGINDPQRETQCQSQSCQGELARKFGNMAVSFRGDGFYSTDKKNKEE